VPLAETAPSPSSPFFGTTAFRYTVNHCQNHDELTYLDDIEIRFATGLEIGMCKFPDILLDLTSIVVDVLDLPGQHSLYIAKHIDVPLRNRTCSAGGRNSKSWNDGTSVV
jgi:hypothetical protein